IIVINNFTYLTKNILVLYFISYRFNSYYSLILYLFIKVIGKFLIEAREKP
ncbi:uncharacterized protein BKA55DRAFT_500203, partial [Fusarium redolens]